jgi:hypothetical protein
MGTRTLNTPQNGDQVHLKTAPGTDLTSAEPIVPARTTLQSWKEIASELNRGVRTVQRWERKLGLPVRRMGSGSRCPVFAFKDELDSWLRSNTGACSGRAPDRSGEKSEAPASEKPPAGLLESLQDFFAPRRSSQDGKNCHQCQSAMQYLEINFWIYGTGSKWRMSVPFCPVCDGDSLVQFQRSQSIQ